MQGSSHTEWGSRSYAPTQCKSVRATRQQPGAARAPHKLLRISQLPLESEPRSCTCLTGAGPPAFCSTGKDSMISNW